MEGEESGRGGERERSAYPVLHPARGTHESLCAETDQTLKQLRTLLAEYQEHLRALDAGEEFVPRLTGSAKKSKSKSKANGNDDEDEDADMSDAENDGGEKRGTKRKSSGGAPRKAKRRRSGGEDDDAFVVSDEDDDLGFDDDESVLASEDGGHGPSDSEFDETEDKDEDDEDDGEGEKEEEGEEEEEVTRESLEAKIKEHQDAIKEGRVMLSDFRRVRKEAMDAIASLKKRESKAQREKNAFCSLKRSEVCSFFSNLLYGLMCLV